MGLSSVQIPFEEVDCLGTTIRLRPLSLKEAGGLLQRHATTLSQAWAAYSPLLQSGGDDHVIQGAAFAFVGHCSDAVADLIATAAGEPDQADVAAKLPIEVQFRIAITIYRLTLSQSDMATIVHDFYDAMGLSAGVRETSH